MAKKSTGSHKRCKCQKHLLNKDQKDYLDEIGLSKHAIRLYELLLIMGPLSAQDAATHTLDFPSAHYRLFYELERCGLIRRSTGRPTVFTALPLHLGLETSLKRRESQLEKLLKNESDKSSDIRIILGRKALYDTYIDCVMAAKEEVNIYSIGIAYSKKLEKSQRQLTQNGVRIRHIIQKHRPSNYHVVHKWLRAGVKLRYLKKTHGFHFFTVDKKWVCITFSDSEDTENRLSILTDNQPATELFRTQFEQLWASARNIKA